MAGAANRWLVKTEPSEFSFERLVREGRTRWDGVMNPLALRHLRAIRKGDPVLVYHTGGVRAAVGLARAASDAYPDPSKKDAKLAVVDLIADRPLPRPVPLVDIRSRPVFRGFDLIRLGRLSVLPVPDRMWNELMKMAGA